MTPPAIAISGLRFAWPRGPLLLDIGHFEVPAGEAVFLSGASGSGKSTLLGLIAGITPCRTGRVDVLGEPMRPDRPAQRDALRAARLGIIFQLFNLLPYLDPLENVLLPLRFSAERAARLRESGAAPEAEARRLLGALAWKPELWSAAPPISASASSSASRPPAPFWAGPASSSPTNRPRRSTMTCATPSSIC